MIWLQIIAVATVCGAIIADVAKNNSQCDQRITDCESCALLQVKNRRSLEEFRYRCSKHGGFDKAPLFCSDYKKRSEEDYAWACTSKAWRCRKKSNQLW